MSENQSGGNTGRGSLSVRNIEPTITDPSSIVFPSMVPVRQRFPQDRVEDVERAVLQQLEPFAELDLAGKEIAVTAGSRGIKGMAEVLRAIVIQLREWGAVPFLVPAMGSHGGATAEGQIAVLKKLGITEAETGAPIRSSMEVVDLGMTAQGAPIHCDKLAFQSGGIVVCNRIKAHTSFRSDQESGLVKMMLIGLGKHKGATDFHAIGFERFDAVLSEAGRLFLEKAPVLFGVGLVENAYGQVAAIEAAAPEDLIDRERECLRYAKTIMGRILVPEIDVLIVDEIGKDISGAGMDPNITGRSAYGLPGFDLASRIQRIIVRGLTKATAGSAMGIGTADFTTRRCVEQIDLAVTYTNAVTARIPAAPKIPMIAENDRSALVMALKTARIPSSPEAKIVQIRNTKDLEDIWVSEACLAGLAHSDSLPVRGKPQPFRFDEAGELLPWSGS